LESKRAEQVLSGRGGEKGRGREEVAQIMYTHVSKCKNDKLIFKKCPLKVPVRAALPVVFPITFTWQIYKLHIKSVSRQEPSVLCAIISPFTHSIGTSTAQLPL
jgi:hypothetical protein